MQLRQRIIFLLILAVGGVMAFLLWLQRAWLTGNLPPGLDVAATAAALRSTEEALTTAEAALQQTATASISSLQDVLRGERTWNGLRIEVVDVVRDGWPLLKAHNQYNDPPLPGKRMLLITVQVQKIEAASNEPVSIDDSDFRVVGERQEVYNTYSEETRCGVVPNALDGVVIAGRPIRGDICVQVPEQEKNFVLIYDSGDSRQPAVYIPLPEGREIGE